MSDDALGRIRGDLAVMQKAMALRLPFGKGMLCFGLLSTATAAGAAVGSLLVEADRIQVTMFAAIMVLVLIGLFLRTHRTPCLSPEITMQVILSISIYAVVWVAGSGYAMAMLAGPSLGSARTAGLYASSLGLLLPFSLMLVATALKSRERHYCLGLALSPALAGMLLPLFAPHYSYALAHGLMAVGYLTGVAIQWAQLRGAVTNHAAD
jgi:hypothetical protein